MPEVTSAFYKLDEYYDDFTTSTGHDRIIKNNIFLNMATGIHMGPCENGMECILRNDVIENNTILNIGDDILIIADHAVVTNNRIKNNIFDSRTVRGNNRVAYSAVNSGITLGANIWSRPPPTNLSGPGDIVSATRTDVQNYFTQPAKVLNQAVLVPGQVDPLWFAVKPEFQQYGADASRVGATTRPPTNPDPTPSPSPSPSPSTRAGDANGDGAVNIFDYNIILSNFGLTVSGRSQGDFNGNGTVDIFDFQQVVSNLDS
jgi:hypothetical protein